MFKYILIILLLIIIAGIYHIKTTRNFKHIIISENKYYPDWMFLLDKRLKDFKLNMLCYPGTHDSAVYNKIKTDIAIEGQPNWMKYLQIINKYIYNITHKIDNWTITQDNRIYQQLIHGIRYFDIRIGYNKEQDKFYGIHTFAESTIDDIFMDFKSFCIDYPNEIILIKLTCDDLPMNKLIDIINKYIYDNILLNKTNKNIFNKYSINKMNEENKQIFIFNNKYQKYYYELHPEPFYGNWINSSNMCYKSSEFRKQLQHFKLFDERYFFGKISLIDWTITPDTMDRIFSLDSLKNRSYQINNFFNIFLNTLTEEEQQYIGVVAIDFESTYNLVEHILLLNNKKVN